MTDTLTFGSSEKICQLTGEMDWSTGRQTTTQTQQSGLTNTDLGYPVEHNGRLAILFGDTWSNPPLPPHDEFGPPDDAVGWITSRELPTQSECTNLRINHVPVGAGTNILRSPTVVSPPIKQGIFNVPSGGVSSEGWLYAFFWTDHCWPDNPRPCPNSPSLNNVGRGWLARSRDYGVTFSPTVFDYAQMPPGFVYSTAVDTAAIADLPVEQRRGTFIFGVPEYRLSVPYLAYAPPGMLLQPSAWGFFGGFGPDRSPLWLSAKGWEGQGWASEPWNQKTWPSTGQLFGTDRCVGELSVTWNRALQVWLMLYNCNGNVVARIAQAPWGPWSMPAIILDPDRDGSWCKLLMKKDGKNPLCGGLADDWPDSPKQGGFYAPFVMERYTTPEPTSIPGRRQAAIYWLLSTYNPYQVTVMRTMLRVDTLRLAF